MGRGLGIPAPTIVLPYAFVQTVMEIEMFHVLEFRAGGRKQLFNHSDMRIHRAADIQEQQYLDRIASLGTGLDV